MNFSGVGSTAPPNPLWVRLFAVLIINADFGSKKRRFTKNNFVSYHSPSDIGLLWQQLNF